jgi:hypothetical protein
MTPVNEFGLVAARSRGVRVIDIVIGIACITEAERTLIRILHSSTMSQCLPVGNVMLSGVAMSSFGLGIGDVLSRHTRRLRSTHVLLNQVVGI